jgi:RHS repeat-associated protein
MTRTRLHPLFLTLTALLLSEICFGQATGVLPATGMPPFGSFGGGPFDTVNLGNLNVHFSVPVLHKAGRGLPFDYDLSYDSSVWYPVGVNGSQTWQPVSNWGWISLWTGTAGYITNTSYGEYCYGGNGYPIGHTQTISGWTYNDPWGVNHSFGGELVSSTCPGVTNISSFTSLAPDGSGYTMNIGVPGAWGIVNSAGVGFTPGSGPPTGPTATTKSDSNGNQLTSDSSGHFTDTLGSQVLTITGSSPVTFAYTSPSGASAAYVMHYTTKTVKTAFGCSGIAEYGPTSASLVTDITLPDGSKYLFAYEPTPGFTGDYTGRLQSVTLPTGGTITYTYTGGANGITCADGSTSGLTRVLNPGGTWTYAHSNVLGTHWTTSVKDPTTPTPNQTVIDFQEDSATTNPSNNFYETQRQTYQGLQSGGTLLLTNVRCYNNVLSNCTTTAVQSPIVQTDITLQYPSSGQQSKTETKYTGYGLVTDVYQYAYGAGAPGGVLRHTAIAYASLGSIAAREASVIVDNGANTLSNTSFSYDESAYPIQPTSGTPQHGGTIGSSRGNLTTITNYSNSSSNLTRHLQYNDTGTIYKSWDINGAITSYLYDSGANPNGGTNSCGNSFPTSVNLPLSLSSSTTWHCTGGVALTATDVNGKVSTSAYNDPFYWRPASAQDKLLNTTNFTYTAPVSGNPGSTESKMLFNGNSSIAEHLTTLDGLGRVQLSQQQEAPGSGSYDSTQITYDNLGRPYQSTMPYVAGAGQGSTTAAKTTTSYDALGRATQVQDGGTGYTTYTYSQNDRLQASGPAPAGETLKQKQLEYDALGRLTSVCEVTAGSASGPAGACAQNTAIPSPGTGYFATYVYDTTTINSVLYNRVTVTQNAQAVQSLRQTRVYVSDLLGRLVSETNPETGNLAPGITTYVFDTDSSGQCSGTYNGDPVKKVDNRGNKTCYTYDSLHRILGITYASTSPDFSNTPAKSFVYDAATLNGVPMSNPKGHLVEAYTGSSSSKVTDEFLSYSVRGELTDAYQSTPHSGSTYYHVTAGFWANGALNTLTSNISGLPSQTYGADGEGRPSSVTAGTGQNPVTSTSYDLVNYKMTVNYGSLDSDVLTLDPNTGRLAKYQFNVGSNSDIGVLTWNANSSLKTLAIADTVPSTTDTQTCNYTHDDLARVASANCGSAWNETFSYDAFGNITKNATVGTSFTPGYSPTTNQFTSLPGITPTYDTDGRLTYDGTHNYAWDAESKMHSEDTTTLTYDAFGRMVEKAVSTTYTQIVYSPLGKKVAVMSGQTMQQGFIPLPTGSTAVYTPAGLAYYRHADHLGSSRLAATPSRTLYSSTAYAPFGEAYKQAGTTDLSFTGQDQDTVSGMHDFLDRRYTPVQGRWLTPDPIGLAAVDPASPQSWNRYAYVTNNPLALVDPFGDFEYVCYPCNPPPWGPGSPGPPGTCTGVCGNPGNPGGGGLGGNLSPANPEKKKQCAAIYQSYLDAVSDQKWKNVATVAVAAGGGCWAAGPGCLKGAWVSAAIMDANLALSNWGLDVIDLSYRDQLLSAGCDKVSGW